MDPSQPQNPSFRDPCLARMRRVYPRVACYLYPSYLSIQERSIHTSYVSVSYQ